MVFGLSTAAACSGKVTQAGGLEVKIFTTNLAVGTDFDELNVLVAQETPGGWRAHTPYDNNNLPSSFPFPTGFAIAAGPSPDQNVRVTITGLLGGNPVVRSEAQTTVPTSQVLELDMYLTRTCLNTLCAADATTCVEGTCKGIQVPASALVAYTPVDNGGGGSSGTGGSSGGDGRDASLGAHSDGSTDGVDSGTGGPVCNLAGCTGCCDPKGGCVISGSTCSNGMSCTGPGGSCSGSSTCSATDMAQFQAMCAAMPGGCYTGGCTCTMCAAGQACVAGACTGATGMDSGAFCSPNSCPTGCCDSNGACVAMGAQCPSSGGICSGTNGATCSGAGSPCASGALCPTGCCAGTGACIPVGSACPNARTCTIAGTACQMAGMCGAAGQPCCPPDNVCASGSSCSAGICSGGTTMTCSIPNEPVAATVAVDAMMAATTFSAIDGFVVLTGGGSGPMSALFYLMNYANACGYAQSSSAKSGGDYITFGVSPTSGSGYSSLVGTFHAGGSNLGPGIAIEAPSGTICQQRYSVGMCGSGSLNINITSASATQVVGSFSGSCTPPDKLTGSFTLPVCGTSLSPQGTSACCP